MVELWEAHDVAQRAGRTADAIRAWEKSGRLVPWAKTPRGVRLYQPEVVKEALKVMGQPRDMSGDTPAPGRPGRR